MKSYLMHTFLIILLINLSHAYAQDTEDTGVDIHVTVVHVSNEEGRVLLSLHTKQTWLKGPGVQNLSAEIKEGHSEAIFRNVPKGTYAIMVMHDENDNNDMDVNKLGLPTEQYGTSRNPAKIGPPIFNASKFKVKNEDLEFRIKV